MTPAVEIEGERFFCYADTREGDRIKPGFYVRERWLERLIRVDDPVWPHRVCDALALGAEPRRALVAVGGDGVPHPIETVTESIEHGIDPGEGYRWRAVVVLMPRGSRAEPVRITLPRQAPASPPAAVPG